MMNKTFDEVKAVIFDLDGTLLYTLQDLKDSVNHVLEMHGMPERTLTEIRDFVGNGIRKTLERAAVTGTPDDEVEVMYNEFNEYYDKHCMDATGPYDGIPDMLKELYEKGYKLAIVSNKHDTAVKELNEMFFKEYISVAIGESPKVRRKPAPDTAITAMKELGVSSSEAIYVGDSDVDIKTAENAGLPCVSVTWGFRDREFLKENGAEILIDKPEELIEIFS